MTVDATGLLDELSKQADLKEVLEAVLLVGSRTGEAIDPLSDYDLLVITASVRLSRIVPSDAGALDIICGTMERFLERLDEFRWDNNNFLVNALQHVQVLHDPRQIAGRLIGKAQRMHASGPRALPARERERGLLTITKMLEAARKAELRSRHGDPHGTTLARIAIDELAVRALYFDRALRRQWSGSLRFMITDMTHSQPWFHPLWTAFAAAESLAERFHIAEQIAQQTLVKAQTMLVEAASHGLSTR